MPDAHANVEMSLLPFWESPGTRRLHTNLLKYAGTEAVQTVEQREDINRAVDVDPLKSFHLRRQDLCHEHPKPEQSNQTQRKMPTALVRSIRARQPPSEGTLPLLLL